VKIGFDACALLLPITGIGRYTQQVAKYLNKIKKNEDEIIYFWGPGTQETNYFKKNIEKSKHTHRNSIRGMQTLWEQFILPRKMFKHNLDIYHSPRNKNISYFKINSNPIILTMHDTLVFLYPQKNLYAKIIRLRWYRAAKLADKIITVSKNSKTDLLQQFKFLNEEDIAVNYCGVDKKFKTKNIDIRRLSKIKNKYGIDKKYILASGSTEPVKNNKMLFEVMKLGKEKYNEVFKNIELVIAGPKWPGENIPDDLPDNVNFTGYVEEKDFPVLMNGAELFVFPSLYEGFGLPLLEAMAAETMVITSNTSSIPEVIGEAGIMLDPKSPEIWVDTIKRFFDSEKRYVYIDRGLERINKFSWRKTAEELYMIYEKEIWKANKK